MPKKRRREEIQTQESEEIPKSNVSQSEDLDEPKSKKLKEKSPSNSENEMNEAGDMEEEINEVEAVELEEDEEEEEEQHSFDDGHVDRLEVKLRASPYEYSSHIEYINALRSLGDLQRLREARENFAKLFPLPEDIWLAWIQDESSVANSEEEKEQIITLYQRSLKDFQCISKNNPMLFKLKLYFHKAVRLWCEYLMYVIGNNKDDLSLPEVQKQIRSIFEAALASVGQHFTEGDKIWTSYLEFELELLNYYEEIKDSQEM